MLPMVLQAQVLTGPDGKLTKDCMGDTSHDTRKFLTLASSVKQKNKQDKKQSRYNMSMFCYMLKNNFKQNENNSIL